MPKTPRWKLKTEIDLFLAEFSAFETYFVGMLLRALSYDAMFVEQTEKLLDLEARLTLLKRMAFVRNLDPCVIAQLSGVNLRAGKLRERRDELTRNRGLIEMEGGKSNSRPARSVEDESLHSSNAAGLKNLWLPTMAEIDECRNDTTELQATLRSIAEQVDGRRHLGAGRL